MTPRVRAARRRQSTRPGTWIALAGVLLLAVGAGVLLSNPRHRAFYFGAAGDAPFTSAQTFSLPTPEGLRRAVATPTAASRVVSAALPNTRVPQPDLEGRVRVPVSDSVPGHLPASGRPAGWEVKEFAGDASIELVRNEGRLALRLRSERTSFALYRDVVLDVRQYSMLSWSWKALKLPAGGDLRDPARNDQAAQVYVVFPRWPSLASSDVIGYVWDTQAPVGTTLSHAKAPNVRMVVVESGSAKLDTWQRYTRNVAQDYQTLFGRPAPRMGKVALMIDTNDTRGEAEALFGDLTFFRPGVASMEIPVTMLR